MRVLRALYRFEKFLYLAIFQTAPAYFLQLSALALLSSRAEASHPSSSSSLSRIFIIVLSTMPSFLLYILAALALLLFLLTLYLLPGDAYGEDDVRVFAEEKIRARNRAVIVVLGDIGRSPRMQNHALSLARRNVEVDLVGYCGT